MAPKIGVSQEMVGKCSELDNWNVFHMALCVAYLIMLTVRRLQLAKMTVRNTNCT